MRTGIASIILGALAVLLVLSAVISSLVSLHFTARQNTAVLSLTLAEQADIIQSHVLKWCTVQDCDWQKLLPSGEGSSLAVFDRSFQLLAGHEPQQLNYRAAVQDAFTSRQVQSVTYTEQSNVAVAHARPISLLEQPMVVLLVYAKLPQLAQSNERTNLIVLQAINVLLILGFGVYLMRRSVIGPIGDLESWVRDRRASVVTDAPPEIRRPYEIARLRDAFLDLVQSLDHQQAMVEESRVRLAQTQQQLAHRDRLVTVGRVASGIAHEVGNPLSSVIGFLSLLKEQPDFESLGITEAEIIDRMDKELERVRKAVRRLLDLSSPVVLKPQHMLLSEIISDLEMLVKVRNQAIELKVQFPPGEETTVYFDPGVLVQVLSNLCLNAIEAMGQTGMISISVSVSENEAYTILIADEGPGISLAIRDVLFEPFQTTKREDGGTGLGLSISRSLLESAGGSLTLVDPQPDLGAAFLIRLPGPTKS